MAALNFSGQEINCKIVYYGPGESGKTTNLECLHRAMPALSKGKIVATTTRTDRTLMFDVVAQEIEPIDNYRTRAFVYTVQGQVYYNATRKLLLKDVDAVVFVADSSPDRLEDNLKSLNNLEDNLNEYGQSLDNLPWVIQYNKRDVEGALPIATLHERLNVLDVPAFEATASSGHGVVETFQGIASLVESTLQAGAANGLFDRDPGAEPEAAENVDALLDDAVDTALREVDAMDSVTDGRVVPRAAGQAPAQAPVSPVSKVARPAGVEPEFMATETAAEDEEHVYEIEEESAAKYEEVVAAVSSTESTNVRTTQDAGVQSGASPVHRPAQATDSTPQVSSPPARRNEVTSPAAVPQGPSPVPAPQNAGEEDDGLFSGEKLDEEVGRILELDDVSDAPVPETVRDPQLEDFITDPMKGQSSGASPVAEPEKPAPAAPVLPVETLEPESFEASEPVEISVPVTLTRAQLEGTAPIRLVLELTIYDQ